MVAQLADTITIAEAARRLGLSPTTLRYWIRRGELDTILTPLGKVVVTESLEAFQRNRAALGREDGCRTGTVQAA